MLPWNPHQCHPSTHPPSWDGEHTQTHTAAESCLTCADPSSRKCPCLCSIWSGVRSQWLSQLSTKSKGCKLPEGCCTLNQLIPHTQKEEDTGFFSAKLAFHFCYLPFKVFRFTTVFRLEWWVSNMLLPFYVHKSLVWWVPAWSSIACATRCLKAKLWSLSLN